MEHYQDSNYRESVRRKSQEGLPLTPDALPLTDRFSIFGFEDFPGAAGVERE
jgi:hypothetical protein